MAALGMGEAKRPHWVQADMGMTQTWSLIQIAVGPSSPVFSPGYVRAFLSDSPIGHRWTLLTLVATLTPPFGWAYGNYFTLSFAPNPFPRRAAALYKPLSTNCCELHPYSGTALGD
ncbi:MAG: hypothetical protein NNA23_12225 [Nitrospira sp.]|nr:hypothetical protein [Nitrospira sp.]